MCLSETLRIVDVAVLRIENEAKVINVYYSNPKKILGTLFNQFEYENLLFTIKNQM